MKAKVSDLTKRELEKACEHMKEGRDLHFENKGGETWLVFGGRV